MTNPSPLPRDAFLARLSERLDAKALDSLSELSHGQDDFTGFMLGKLLELLEAVTPRMEERWARRDLAGLASEVHKLRASVSYTGAKTLDELVTQAEPMLKAHDGNPDKAENLRAEELAAQTVAEARSLLEWLRPLLADR